jgi:hypothetical protein
MGDDVKVNEEAEGPKEVWAPATTTETGGAEAETEALGAGTGIVTGTKTGTVRGAGTGTTGLAGTAAGRHKFRALIAASRFTFIALDASNNVPCDGPDLESLALAGDCCC